MTIKRRCRWISPCIHVSHHHYYSCLDAFYYSHPYMYFIFLIFNLVLYWPERPVSYTRTYCSKANVWRYMGLIVLPKVPKSTVLLGVLHTLPNALFWIYTLD